MTASIRELIAQFSLSDRAAQDAAIVSLKVIGAQAIPDLADVIQSGSVNARVCAIRALAEIGGGRAEAVLIAAIKCDAIVAKWAIMALGRMGSDQACRPLRELWSDEQLACLAIESCAAIGCLDCVGDLRVLLKALSQPKRSEDWLKFYYSAKAILKLEGFDAELERHFRRILEFEGRSIHDTWGFMRAEAFRVIAENGRMSREEIESYVVSRVLPVRFEALLQTCKRKESTKEKVDALRRCAEMLGSKDYLARVEAMITESS